MDKIETFDNIVNRIKNYEQAMTPPGVPLRHMDEIYKEAAEQYAAQQVQEITDVGQSGKYWGDQWVKMRERAERAEKQLDEVKRLKDEAVKELAYLNAVQTNEEVPDHVNRAANFYCTGNVLFTSMKTGFFACWRWMSNQNSQLENEKKDAP